MSTSPEGNFDLLVALTSLIIAVVSLFVAVGGAAIALKAWRRPYPADSTRVPTFRLPELRTNDGVLRLFAFLDENAGRKVRLQISLNADANPATSISAHTISFPSPGHKFCSELSINFWGATDQDGSGTPPENQRVGAKYAVGMWFVDGYYANLGQGPMHQGVCAYPLTPLTSVEAVS